MHEHRFPKNRRCQLVCRTHSPLSLDAFHVGGLYVISKKQLVPTGDCWCGCGENTGTGSFFRSGHDKVAESAVILTQFGGVAEFLDHFGFRPGGKNATRELEVWKAGGGQMR